jgi:Flp pilus assembly protein TadD
MTGDETREINEYERATALGLSRWDLFLNLGIAFRVNGNLPAATDALRRAVQLDSEQPEPHYNLGLVVFYEQRSMLTRGALLREAPGYSPARTNLAIIEGKAVDGHVRAFAHAATIPVR